ncbi:MAG: DegT/DnrJ/EryC1/StrS family aminotransferase [Bryobacterales bacterium]|nr:DegT/DnrJ/EryC1/StrS family aminotransferase [Bryobacterales bacterium]
MKRRTFAGTLTAASAASLSATPAPAAPAAPPAAKAKLALHGGTPVRTAKWPSWPRFNQLEEKALLDVLRSGQWGRGGGKAVTRFEAAYANLLGAPHVVATANGTSALIASLGALGIGPGDEVIVPPYTFVATVNAVLLHRALPVFVDSDLETFQIDHRKIEAKLTPRTKLILPVHMAGGPANLDEILALGKRRGIPVIEDACQAHLGEWRGKKVGTLGLTGCFSFQASKNLNAGEGGAVCSSDADFIEKVYTYHTNGRARKTDGSDFSYRQMGANLRLTEFQAALLTAQMTRLEEQSKTRETNAAYLTKLLNEIPGVKPVKNYEGCTRSAWHLYMFRIEKEAFAGVDKDTLLKALKAEGIPISGGYKPLNKEPFLANEFASPAWRAVYGDKTIRDWASNNECPVNDALCSQAMWLTQTMLLGPKQDMEHVAAALSKIQSQAASLRGA